MFNNICIFILWKRQTCHWFLCGKYWLILQTFNIPSACHKLLHGDTLNLICSRFQVSSRRLDHCLHTHTAYTSLKKISWVGLLCVRFTSIIRFLNFCKIREDFSCNSKKNLPKNFPMSSIVTRSPCRHSCP